MSRGEVPGAGLYLECSETPWWFHVCLSCLSDEAKNLVGHWSREVTTLVSSIRQIWVLTKCTTLYHLGNLSKPQLLPLESGDHNSAYAYLTGFL